MIERLLDLAKTLLAMLPFILLCLFNCKVNLPKAERSRQFLMPLITLVYVILAMLLVNKLNNLVLSFLEGLPGLFASLGEVSWMPGALASGFQGISEWLAGLFASANLHYWVFYISNALIILIYFPVKKISVSLLKKIFKQGSKLHGKIAGKFYEYFPEKDKWCLYENYIQARSLLKVFYYGAIVLSCLLMVYSRHLYAEGMLRAMFYPVFGVLVVGEVCFFLDGLARREYSHDILGEDENAYRVVNYSLLRKFLRSLFKDKLLSENTGVNNSLVNDVTNDEIIGELEKNEDPKIATYATYIKHLNSVGFAPDHNYLSSSIDLLNGKSILFNNPFYNDLIPYAFYPMNRILLTHKKVLIVLGRHGMEEDVKEWVERGIGAVTNLPFLWKIGVLSEDAQDLDIGIVSRSGVLNTKLHSENADFLSRVGYTVILEPSKLIPTAQIGLNLLVKQCRDDSAREITYCLCDKNCDGLVDALSHILMTNLTEVSATKKHLGTVSYMCWEADDESWHHRQVPNIARYLGVGTELSFAALKNQVSKTCWYGGEAFPVTDMNWIDKQYYYDLMKYAGQPTSPEAMDDRFRTTPNFWSAQVAENGYITVEDESCNMFEILREFSTRTTEQGFVNIISPEYLLKDYMADNASIFEADAKAIPCIVADYARTPRNTVLRLMLMMSVNGVSDSVLTKELSLIGISVFDLSKQLWYELYKCYASLEVLSALPEEYEEAVENVWNMPILLREKEITHDIFRTETAFSLRSGRVETTYRIEDDAFFAYCVDELRFAGYVAEDEKGETNFLGSELRGHIYQKYLPGQFFTFAGKYYEMQYLTADGQVLVRRAADHIDGRPSYRQMRNYTICGLRTAEQIGARKNISGMVVTREYADLRVETPGYYNMGRYNDFASAKQVRFEGSKNGIPSRSYRNKEILRIQLPALAGKDGDRVRYTVAVLFNEVFRTLFAENAPYICALTDDSFLKEEELHPLTYTVCGEGCELSSDSIYIVEDSQLDLGLTVAVERNLQRIFRIVHDYLDWHMGMMDSSVNPPVDPEPPVVFGEEAEGEDGQNGEGTGKKKGFFRRLWEKIKGWFKRKPKKPAEETPYEEDPSEEEMPPEEVPAEAEPAEEGGEGQESMENPAVECPPEDVPVSVETPAEEGEDLFRRKPYHERYYTLFGGTEDPTSLDLAAALAYLTSLGFDKNTLKQAREGKKVAERVSATFKPNRKNARYCDFCGAEIYGVEYETLADGRDRCINCGRTAIKTEEEFRKIFEDVRRNMEAFYGIKINVGIKVEMVNSKTLHKKLGHSFVPTAGSDGRILGVAIKDKKGEFSLMVENGSPRMASMLTIAHELTHIWQYLNWNDKYIKKKYGKGMRLEIYEGMAKWVEIQYAYLINEATVAKREEIITSYRDDEYGHGFLRYHANYPFSTGTVITRPTPFENIEEPLDPQYCGAISVRLPEIPGQSGADDDGSAGGSGGGNPENPIKGPRERNPKKVRPYALNLLNESEKKVYNQLLEAMNRFVERVEPLAASVKVPVLEKILDYIQRDHPEIFWFNFGARYSYSTETNIVSRVEMTYCMTPAEAERRKEKIESSLKSFLASVNDKMSDYEVTLRIHRNIIDLVDYDTIGLERQKKTGTSPEKPDNLRSIYGVFVEKKAVCAGYAKATQYLFNRCGIECTYVTSDTHAWNLLRLEGDYYHLDTTWGDLSDTKKEKNVSNRVTYDCFCITTEEVLRLKDHKPSEGFPLPRCTATKCNYFRRHGLYLEQFQPERMRDTLCKRLAQGKTEVTWKFATNALYREAHKQLIDGNQFCEMLQYANRKGVARVDTSFRYSEKPEVGTITFLLTLRT